MLSWVLSRSTELVNLTGFVGTPVFVVNLSEVQVAWGPYLWLASAAGLVFPETLSLNLWSLTWTQGCQCHNWNRVEVGVEKEQYYFYLKFSLNLRQ